MAVSLSQRGLTPAGIQNVLLGGLDNTEADREVARALAEKHPILAPLNRQNRRYTERAVGQLAESGIRRFLDLGCGLRVKYPDGTAEPMVHEAAGPGARVVYVDSDPIVVQHVHAATIGNGNVTVVKGDLADPGSLHIGEELRELTADGEPVGVILAAVLHYWPVSVAQEIVCWYAQALPDGSAVVITAAHFEDEAAMDERRRMLPSMPFWNHSRRAVESFFGVAWLDLDAPVADVAPVSLAGSPKAARMLGGVGRKAR